MSYEFHRLQMIHCFGAISVRAPARWQRNEESEDLLSFHEEGADTGTLWINLQHLDTGEDDRDPSTLVRENLEGLRSGLDENSPEIEELAPAKCLWRRVFDSTDSEGTIRNFWYTVGLAKAGQFALVNFKLVLPEGVIDDPEFRALVELMDHEIRTANFYPFNLDGTFIQPLQRRYFGGKLALELPNMMRRSPTNTDEHRSEWYCYFPPELPARMRVEIREQVLADEDSREPISIDPEHYEVFPEYVGLLSEAEPYDLRRMTDGVLIHRVLDIANHGIEPSGEPDDSTPAWFAEPLRAHEWTYYRFVHGQVRTVTFFLFFPRRCASELPVISVVEVLDRAIPGAQFPDLEAANEAGASPAA
jgi:hypothetical protein